MAPKTALDVCAFALMLSASDRLLGCRKTVPAGLCLLPAHGDGPVRSAIRLHVSHPEADSRPSMGPVRRTVSIVGCHAWLFTEYLVTDSRTAASRDLAKERITTRRTLRSTRPRMRATLPARRNRSTTTSLVVSLHAARKMQRVCKRRSTLHAAEKGSLPAVSSLSFGVLMTDLAYS
jgi:hypothetical protein